MINGPVVIVVLLQELVDFGEQLVHVGIDQMPRPDKMADDVPQTLGYVQIIHQDIVQLLAELHEIELLDVQHLFDQIVANQVEDVVRDIFHPLHQRKRIHLFRVDYAARVNRVEYLPNLRYILARFLADAPHKLRCVALVRSRIRLMSVDGVRIGAFDGDARAAMDDAVRQKTHMLSDDEELDANAGMHHLGLLHVAVEHLKQFVVYPMEILAHDDAQLLGAHRDHIHNLEKEFVPKRAAVAAQHRHVDFVVDVGNAVGIRDFIGLHAHLFAVFESGGRIVRQYPQALRVFPAAGGAVKNQVAEGLDRGGQLREQRIELGMEVVLRRGC